MASVGRIMRCSVVGPFCLRALEYDPEISIAAHSHSTSNISLLLSGSLEERVGDQVHWPSPGQLVVKPAGTVHSNRFGSQGARILQIEISTGWGPSVDSQAPLPEWRWLWDARMIRSLLEIYASPNQGTGEQDTPISGQIEELLALLPPAWSAPSRIPDWLGRMRTIIEKTFHEPISVAELSRQFRKHPVYIARVFRRYFGSTIKEYVRTLRIQAAAAQLASSQSDAADIAFRSGFSDQSHMCRCFKTEMGVTPLGFRRLVR